MTNRYFDDVKQGDEFKESWRPDGDQVAAYMSVQDPSADPEADAHHPGARATVPGGLAFCIASRTVEHWMGALGKMRSVDGEYRRPIMPDDSLEAHTVVTRVDAGGARPSVELEVFIQNGKGERALQGSAVVELPRRA